MDENNQNNDANNQPTQDDQEWDRAFDEFLANKGINPAEAGPGKDDKPAAGADKDGGAANADKPDAEKRGEVDKDKAPEGADANRTTEEDEEDVTAPIREQRAIQRELAEDRKQTMADIREKMFNDMKTELMDADGDPIRTPEDVMKLLNPNTGKAFTYEEASSYLLQAQQHLNRENEKIEAQIEEYADVNIAMKDEATAVRSRWGKLLAAKPDLAKETWADYKATLVVDKKTGIITGAPVSMERFYNRALAGYESSAEQLQTADKARQEAEAKAARAQNKADRTDITSSGRSDTMDDDEKEWATAFENHYGKKS
jgi:hypothetical protein